MAVYNITKMMMVIKLILLFCIHQSKNTHLLLIIFSHFLLFIVFPFYVKYIWSFLHNVFHKDRKCICLICCRVLITGLSRGSINMHLNERLNEWIRVNWGEGCCLYLQSSSSYYAKVSGLKCL